MKLNLSELKRPKLPIVLAYLNSVIDNNTLWSPPRKRESTVAITPVNTEEGVSVQFDPEAGDRLPERREQGDVPEPVIAKEEQPGAVESEEVRSDVKIKEDKELEESSSFVIKEL